MNLKIFDISIHFDTVVLAAHIILSLASEDLYKLAVESISHNPISPSIFLAFWYDKLLYIACPTESAMFPRGPNSF